jgi:hypothetical protein
MIKNELIQFLTVLYNNIDIDFRAERKQKLKRRTL